MWPLGERSPSKHATHPMIPSAGSVLEKVGLWRWETHPLMGTGGHEGAQEGSGL